MTLQVQIPTLSELLRGTNPRNEIYLAEFKPVCRLPLLPGSAGGRLSAPDCKLSYEVSRDTYPYQVISAISHQQGFIQLQSGISGRIPRAICGAAPELKVSGRPFAV